MRSTSSLSFDNSSWANADLESLARDGNSSYPSHLPPLAPREPRRKLKNSTKSGDSTSIRTSSTTQSSSTAASSGPSLSQHFLLEEEESFSRRSRHKVLDTIYKPPALRRPFDFDADGSVRSEGDESPDVIAPLPAQSLSECCHLTSPPTSIDPPKGTSTDGHDDCLRSNAVKVPMGSMDDTVIVAPVFSRDPALGISEKINKAPRERVAIPTEIEEYMLNLSSPARLDFKQDTYTSATAATDEENPASAHSRTTVSSANNPFASPEGRFRRTKRNNNGRSKTSPTSVAEEQLCSFLAFTTLLDECSTIPTSHVKGHAAGGATGGSRKGRNWPGKMNKLATLPEVGCDETYAIEPAASAASFKANKLPWVAPTMKLKRKAGNSRGRTRQLSPPRLLANMLSQQLGGNKSSATGNTGKGGLPTVPLS